MSKLTSTGQGLRKPFDYNEAYALHLVFQGDRKFCQKSYSSDDRIFIFQSLQVRETKRYFFMLSGIWSKFLCRIFCADRSISQAVRQFVDLCLVCLSAISLFAVCLCLFVRLPVCLSICLSLSVCPSMWSVCLSISHSVYRSVSRGLVSSMVSQVRSRASSDINSVCNTATKLNRPVGFFGVTVIAYVFERL